MSMTAVTPVLRGRLLFNESMARHTTWRVGGPADRYYQPADIDDLAAFLVGLPENEPLYWFGLGSNLLVRDGGIRGTVISTNGILKGITPHGATDVWVEAGVSCAVLARFCSRNGMRGAEFFAGIPGTIGGALAMNAGCFGRETWHLVSEVEVLDRHGERHLRRATEYQVGYRHVAGPPDEWFIGALLHLEPGDSCEAAAQVKQFLARRARTQPTRQPSAGSVFCNPPNGYAARLIEEAGLKGYRIGGACISDVHANFIINCGEATAADIEALIEHVQHTVKDCHGIDLVREIRIVGVHQ